jgi:hypothetical protein
MYKIFLADADKSIWMIVETAICKGYNVKNLKGPATWEKWTG